MWWPLKKRAPFCLNMSGTSRPLIQHHIPPPRTETWMALLSRLKTCIVQECTLFCLLVIQCHALYHSISKNDREHFCNMHHWKRTILRSLFFWVVVTHQWVLGTSVSKLCIPRRIDHHAVLQCQAPVTQWHDAISQKNRDLSRTTVQPYIYGLYYLTGKSGKDQTQRHSGQNWCFRWISAPLSGKNSDCCLWLLSVPQGKSDKILSHIP